MKNRANLGLGITQFYLQSYNESISTLNSIQEEDNSFEPNKVNFYLAEDNFALNKYKQALEKYQMVDLTDSTIGKFAMYGKAYTYFDLHNYQNSTLQFSDFIKKYPKDSRTIRCKTETGRQLLWQQKLCIGQQNL